MRSLQFKMMAKGRKPSGGGSNTVPQVTGLTATVMFTNQVYIQWNGVANATSYWIYRNNYVIAIIQNINYMDIANSGTYTYEVAAVVNQVLGPKSISVMATIK